MGRSPIEDFLQGGLAGHCEYFASAMVVLTRSLGMSARLVTGFAGGRPNEIGGFIEITRSDAHAWVEIHFPQAGWVRYDPTPPDLRLRANGALSLGEQISQLASVLELWWFQRVVDFDSSDQILALKSAFFFVKGLIPDSHDSIAPSQPEDGTRLRLPGSDLGWWKGMLMILLGLVGTVLIHRRLRESRANALPPTYRRALRVLARRGLVRGPCMTARAFALEVNGAVSPLAATSFARITDAYLAQRFGGQRATPDQSALARALADLELSLSRR